MSLGMILAGSQMPTIKLPQSGVTPVPPGRIIKQPMSALLILAMSKKNFSLYDKKFESTTTRKVHIFVTVFTK